MLMAFTRYSEPTPQYHRRRLDKHSRTPWERLEEHQQKAYWCLYYGEKFGCLNDWDVQFLLGMAGWSRSTSAAQVLKVDDIYYRVKEVLEEQQEREDWW